MSLDRFGTAAELHRLAYRFPTLEITIVSWTHGAFVYVSPPTPAEEAGLMRQWLDGYHVPSTAFTPGPGTVLLVDADDVLVHRQHVGG